MSSPASNRCVANECRTLFLRFPRLRAGRDEIRRLPFRWRTSARRGELHEPASPGTDGRSRRSPARARVTRPSRSDVHRGGMRGWGAGLRPLWGTSPLSRRRTDSPPRRGRGRHRRVDNPALRLGPRLRCRVFPATHAGFGRYGKRPARPRVERHASPRGPMRSFRVSESDTDASGYRPEAVRPQRGRREGTESPEGDAARRRVDVGRKRRCAEADDAGAALSN